MLNGIYLNKLAGGLEWKVSQEGRNHARQIEPGSQE